jgi:hypothetical protein
MNSGVQPASLYRTSVGEAAGLTGGTPVDGVAVSGTSTFRGDPVNIARLPNASFGLQWTGTPSGTFTVQVSNKPSPDLTTDTDWTLLTLARPITQPAGAAGNEFVDLSQLGARWARPKYVNASGSGTIFCWAVGK